MGIERILPADVSPEDLGRAITDAVESGPPATVSHFAGGFVPLTPRDRRPTRPNRLRPYGQGSRPDHRGLGSRPARRAAVRSRSDWPRELAAQRRPHAACRRRRVRRDGGSAARHARRDLRAGRRGAFGGERFARHGDARQARAAGRAAPAGADRPQPRRPLDGAAAGGDRVDLVDRADARAVHGGRRRASASRATRRSRSTRWRRGATGRPWRRWRRPTR